ncbi:MAG: hypothetical protein ACO3CC_16440 [Alphaproteobacteria bacterium]
MGGVIRVAPGAGNDLQEAVDRAHPGDEILLLAGEHRPRATSRPGGRAGQPVVGRGEEGAHLVGPALPSPPDLFRMGIDGLPSLATWAFLRILRCGHVVVRDLRMESCWPSGVYAEDAWDLAFEGCRIEGGSYPFFVRDTRIKDPRSRGIVVRRCRWVQDTRIWKDLKWKDVHHGDLEYLNGALLGTADVLGGIEFSGNVVEDAFNAMRFDITGQLRDGFPEEVARRNRDIFVFDNRFERIRDNVLEPESWAWNMHFHHNVVVDGHAPVSLDGVGGGFWYIYANQFRFLTRPGRPVRGHSARSGKIIKLAGYPAHPSRRWYFLSNSIFCRSAVLGDGDSFGVPIWNLVAHDNVIAGGEPVHDGTEFACPPCINAIDLDFVLRGDTEFAGTVTNLSSWGSALARAGYAEDRAITVSAAVPLFADGPSGDLAPLPGSPARGSGRSLEIQLPGGETFDWPNGLDRGAVQVGAVCMPVIPMRST